MDFQAHRGVSTEAPENTLPAIELAIAQGYDVIEMDVDVTADNRFVLLHDHHLGRTARTREGGQVPDGLQISDVTYEEALQYDYGLWFSSKYEGTPIPLLEDILPIARENGVRVKIDNKYERFSQENRKALYRLLKPYQNIAELTCYNISSITEALEVLTDMHFHYDGLVNDDTLGELSRILPPERFTVWIPIQNRLTTWVKVPFADKPLADKIKKYAKLGMWIISSYEDADFARELGADIVETNGLIKPRGKVGIKADMHTHSESSHDSKAKLEDMREAQMKKGINMFAVTDHFDTHSYGVYDLHTPIAQAHARAELLNSDGTDCRILKGIELGEAFWSKEAYDRIRKLDYDVIIGSVHVIREEEGYNIYSHTDFSQMPEEEIYQLLELYFDDMLTMLKCVDFDILAHLNCPERNIRGQFKRDISLDRFADKIDAVLKELIRSGKALEVNTSGYAMMGETLPSRDILQRYYDLGGYLVTLGSDAHTPTNAAAYFDEAIALIKKIGFKHLYYYDKRKAIQYEI